MDEPTQPYEAGQPHPRGGSDAAAALHELVVTLAPREREALGHLSQGLTYEQIARAMGISRHTVDTYLRRVRTKTGMHNGAELGRLALALDVPEP